VYPHDNTELDVLANVNPLPAATSCTPDGTVGHAEVQSVIVAVPETAVVATSICAL
jgi:hypothetical protein